MLSDEEFNYARAANSLVRSFSGFGSINGRAFRIPDYLQAVEFH